MVSLPACLPTYLYIDMLTGRWHPVASRAHRRLLLLPTRVSRSRQCKGQCEVLVKGQAMGEAMWRGSSQPVSTSYPSNAQLIIYHTSISYPSNAQLECWTCMIPVPFGQGPGGVPGPGPGGVPGPGVVPGSGGVPSPSTARRWHGLRWRPRPRWRTLWSRPRWRAAQHRQLLVWASRGVGQVPCQ